MKLQPEFLWGRRPEQRMLVPVVVLVILIQLLAVWSIVAGRRGARDAVRQELELRTLANARSMEALLATLRGDCLAVARSPLTARFVATRDDPDPLVRRWSRLDVEAMLLLFVETNAPVERASLVDETEQPLVVVARRDGVPELVAPEGAPASPGTDGFPDPDLADEIWGEWELGSAGSPTGSLRIWIQPQRLLEVVAPGFEEQLELFTGEHPSAAAADGPAEPLVAQRQISDPHWQPPLSWTLVRREPAGGLLASVEEVTDRLGLQAAVSLALMILALLLGRFAFRQVRRAARFEAAAEQQARVRLLERQLAHSERLASVGRLAAGFAHEINNPLAGMLNHLVLLQDDLAEGNEQAAAKQAARVREGLDRVAGIVRRVLTFAGPRPAMEDGELEVVDLRQVVEDTVAFVGTDPDHREVEIQRLFPEGPVAVKGDAVALGQLVLNLLLNACQSERCRQIEARLGTTEDSAVLTVLDDGDGFEEDALEHLFEPFFSTRGTSGLGLAVCHGLVRDHGGEIRAWNRTSEGGSPSRGPGGAAVEVRLPLAIRAESSAGEMGV